MKRLTRFFVLLGLVACTALGHAQQVSVVEKELSNGMKVLMLPRKGEPTISGGWVARVGSANERPGITGIAHLFEHMMFKGTPTLGTKDYKKDLEIINEQERLRDLMRAEEGKMRDLYRKGEIADPYKPENKTARYKELEKQFNELIKQQREIMVKNEFDRVYTAAGGSQMNAFTSTDMTAYFITVPANRLEFWMWMESERLLRPVFREFYAERDVVFEERRMRTESTPTGRLEEMFNAMFWESHPYSWPTVGWPSDIPAISKVQADEFYALYYQPQNLTLVLVGDFDPKDCAAQCERYFGRIAKGKQPAPDVVTLEMKQAGEKRMNGEAEANPMVDILYHTVPFGHKDSYALEVLGQLLSTRTGRLYKGMVLGKQVATETWARQDGYRWAGSFNIGGECKDGVTPEKVEEAIYAEIEKIQNETVSAEELQKVKNNFAASEYRKLANNHAIMFQLIYNEGFGDWKEINESGKKVQTVTADDVKRVANEYFKKENRAVATYTRKPGKEGAAGGDDIFAGLSEEQKSVIRKVQGSIQAESSVEKLKQAQEQITKQMGGADAKNKPFLQAYLKMVTERINALEKGTK
ncbi:MAG TPA: pitrilysin family protein [Verrucomicrobiae bacterium]